MPLPPTLPPRSPPSPPQRPLQQSSSSSRHYITHGRRTRWHGTYCGRQRHDDCIFRVLDASPTRSMGRGCFGISTGEVGGGKERFQMAVFALFRWYVFFSSFPPKQNEVRIRLLSQTRPRYDLRYLFLFSVTFLLLLLSYLHIYLPTHSPFFSLH